MAVRFVCGSITAGLLAWGVVAGTAERVQAQGTQGMAPGEATLVGCLQRGGEHNKLVLAKPTTQTVTSVPEPTCTASSNDEMLVLKDIKHRLDDSMIGRWIEVNGRLKKEVNPTTTDDLREFHMRDFKVIPVVVPKAAPPPPPPVAAAPPPPPEQPAAAPPEPVATTGVIVAEEQVLPKTASPLPTIALISLMSLAGGLALRLFRRQREG